MAKGDKMQNVSFRNVDEFLDYLPENELKITEVLRELVFDCIPDVKEKLSYNVPFYKRHKSICFIWPASVLWGKTKTYSGVRFGFTNGYLLHDDTNYLNKDGRKQVYMKDFNNVLDIDTELMRSFLFESVLIDDNMKNNK